MAATPLVELSDAIGSRARVFGKWEGAHATGSTKDPMAGVALASLVQRGIRDFVFTSTGNSGEAFGWALDRFPELRATLLLPGGFPPPSVVPQNLEVHHCTGTYAEAHTHARERAAQLGIHREEGFFSLGRREGLKVAYLEALLAMPTAPSVIVQCVSSGMGLLSAARAVRHLRDEGHDVDPKIVGVQQESCAPLVSAFSDDAPGIRATDKVARPDGVSIATLLGDPTSSYPDVRRTLAASGGTMLAVDAASAIDAQSQLNGAGLAVCMASSLAAAAVAQLEAHGIVDGDDAILVMLTGGATCSAGRAEAARAASSPGGSVRRRSPAF